MDSEQEAKTCQETSKFIDQELCGLKTRYEAIEQDLKNIRTELTHALDQWDKYKDERDKLRKLAKYWKQRTLEKSAHKAFMIKSTKSPLLINKIKTYL